MISTGTLMLGKALLTAGAALGFCFWQLWVLRRDQVRDRNLQQDRSSSDESASSGA